MDSEIARQRAVAAVLALGHPTDETNVEQMMFMFRVYEVFIARNSVRKDLWKEYGAEDTISHMRSKYSRVARLFKDFMGDQSDILSDEMFDDLFDLINYSIFFGRNVEAGRLNEVLS